MCVTHLECSFGLNAKQHFNFGKYRDLATPLATMPGEEEARKSALKQSSSSPHHPGPSPPASGGARQNTRKKSVDFSISSICPAILHHDDATSSAAWVPSNTGDQWEGGGESRKGLSQSLQEDSGSFGKTRENSRSRRPSLESANSEGGRNNPEASIFRVLAAISENRVNVMLARSRVTENASLVQKNFVSAYNGNRELTNNNSDIVYRSRLAILDWLATKARGSVKIAYVEALKHKEHLNFLRHRVKLNQQVLDITLMMAEVNAKAIEANAGVMATNQEIVNFNTKMLKENTEWLKNGPHLLEAGSRMKLAEQRKSNITLANKMAALAAQTTVKIVNNISDSETNRDAIHKANETIARRRSEIHNNRKVGTKQQTRVDSLYNVSAFDTDLDEAQGSSYQAPEINLGGLGLLGKLMSPESSSSSPTPNSSYKRRVEDEISESTIAQMKENRTKVHGLTLMVSDTRTHAFEARSLVQENQLLVAKNFSFGVYGNRQMSNQNTENLFQNRYEILNMLGRRTEEVEEQQYAQALVHRAKLYWCQLRAALNQQVLDTTRLHAAVNAMSLQVNERVMKTNASIVYFNQQMIEANDKWLTAGPETLISDATQEKLDKLVEINRLTILDLKNLSMDDEAKIKQCLAVAQKNNAQIIENEKLMEQRFRCACMLDRADIVLSARIYSPLTCPLVFILHAVKWRRTECKSLRTSMPSPRSWSYWTRS